MGRKPQVSDFVKDMINATLERHGPVKDAPPGSPRPRRGNFHVVTQLGAEPGLEPSLCSALGCPTPVIPALRRLGQEKSESEASLAYVIEA